MLRRMLLFFRKHIMKLDDRSQVEIAIENGFKMGVNCHIMEGCIIDPGHCFLITLGDNVCLAPRVHLLAHDASTKQTLGYTKNRACQYRERLLHRCKFNRPARGDNRQRLNSRCEFACEQGYPRGERLCRKPRKIYLQCRGLL